MALWDEWVKLLYGMGRSRWGEVPLDVWVKLGIALWHWWVKLNK